jgi:thiamine biosynthesis lipoprotein
MQRRQYLRWSLGLAGSLMSGRLIADTPTLKVSPAVTPLIWRERLLVGFGTSLWLKAGHHNADQLEAALTSAVQAIRSVERQMSLFDPDSGLSRLNRNGVLHRPDAHLRTVLHAASQVSQRSGGAFDVSMQPIWRVWSEAADMGSLPSPRAVQGAQRQVNWRAVEVGTSQIRLNQAGMQLSLNGIAQGYASDLVRASLQAHGIRHALIDAGEVSLLGEGPDAKPWTLDVESAAAVTAAHAMKGDRLSPQENASNGRHFGPPPVLISDGRAVATSSDAHTVFSPDHQHHHIMNPRTGYSPQHWSSVTVIAPACVLADALTKVFFMLPPSRVQAAARYWGVDVVMQDKKGQWLSTQLG